MRVRLVGPTLHITFAGLVPYKKIFRYGLQISRLIRAQVEAKKAYDTGRRGKVAHSALQDAKVCQSHGFSG